MIPRESLSCEMTEENDTQILQRISLDIGPLYIHALPSLVLTVMLKGRGAPVVGWLGTLIVRATLPSPSVLVYMSVA